MIQDLRMTSQAKSTTFQGTNFFPPQKFFNVNLFQFFFSPPRNILFFPPWKYFFLTPQTPMCPNRCSRSNRKPQTQQPRHHRRSHLLLQRRLCPWVLSFPPFPLISQRRQISTRKNYRVGIKFPVFSC